MNVNCHGDATGVTMYTRLLPTLAPKNRGDMTLQRGEGGEGGGEVYLFCVGLTSSVFLRGGIFLSLNALDRVRLFKVKNKRLH